MEEPKLKRFVWRDEDTWKLIQVWRRNILNLRRTKRNKYVYDNMSRELQSMGLIIGIEEIRNKIKNLTKKYRYVYLNTNNVALLPKCWVLFLYCLFIILCMYTGCF